MKIVSTWASEKWQCKKDATAITLKCVNNQAETSQAISIPVRIRASENAKIVVTSFASSSAVSVDFKTLDEVK